MKTLNLQQCFTINIGWSWGRRNCRTFPRTYSKNPTKILILVMHVQFKIISHIKSNEAPHKSMKIFIIATRYTLYWMCTKFKRSCNQNFLSIFCKWQLHPLLCLVLYCEFLKPTILNIRRYVIYKILTPN